MTPEVLAEWRAACDGESVFHETRIVALIDALEDMTREARLSREATEKAIGSRVARHEVERALRAADAPEDSMATDDDLIRYEGRAEAVAIMRDMLDEHYH